MTLLYIPIGVIAYLAIAVIITRLRLWLITKNWYWSTWQIAGDIPDGNLGRPWYLPFHDGRKVVHIWGAIWPVTVVWEILGLATAVVAGTLWLALRACTGLGTGVLQSVKWLARV